MPPGTMRDWAEIKHDTEQAVARTGLPPEGLLISRFGYPALLRPIPGNPDGSGRLPRGLNPVFAGHPVFWMGPERLRQPRESDEVWHVRLWLELVSRNLIDPANGLTLNVLAERLGVDVMEPDGRRRIVAYINGDRSDKAMNSFVLEPPPAWKLPEGGTAAAARRLVAKGEKAWAAMMAHHERTIQTEWKLAKSYLTACKPEELLKDLRLAIVEVASTQGAINARRNLAEVASALLVKVDKLYDAAAILWIPVVTETGVDELEKKTKADQAKRKDQLEELVAAVYRSNGAEEDLKMLWNTFNRWVNQAMIQASRALELSPEPPTVIKYLSEMDQPSNIGFEHLPPPPKRLNEVAHGLVLPPEDRAKDGFAEWEGT